MTTLKIDFSWQRHVDGYVVRGDRIKPKGSRTEDFRPLDFHAALYSQFAKLDGEPETFLDFMGKFGPLTHDGHGVGELIDDLIGRWLMMQRWLELAESNPLDLLRIDATSPARRKALREHWKATLKKRTKLKPRKNQSLPINLTANVIAHITPGPPDGRPVFTLAPDTLWDAMLVQFFQDIGTGAHFKSCLRCGIWFSTGGDSGKRADAKFCSNDCRIRHHLDKTKREGKSQ